jgi:hypothetical protein
LGGDGYCSKREGRTKASADSMDGPRTSTMAVPLHFSWRLRGWTMRCEGRIAVRKREWLVDRPAGPVLKTSYSAAPKLKTRKQLVKQDVWDNPLMERRGRDRALRESERERPGGVMARGLSDRPGEMVVTDKTSSMGNDATRRLRRIRWRPIMASKSHESLAGPSLRLSPWPGWITGWILMRRSMARGRDLGPPSSVLSPWAPRPWHRLLRLMHWHVMEVGGSGSALARF